jgi:hypothetical protein
MVCYFFSFSFTPCMPNQGVMMISPFFPFRSFSTGQNRRVFKPSRSCLGTVKSRYSNWLLSLLSALKKQNLFITYTTHFRSFQSLKACIFQCKSLHCCHTLLKINKYFPYISGTVQDSVKIQAELNSL